MLGFFWKTVFRQNFQTVFSLRKYLRSRCVRLTFCRKRGPRFVIKCDYSHLSIIRHSRYLFSRFNASFNYPSASIIRQHLSWTRRWRKIESWLHFRNWSSRIDKQPQTCCVKTDHILFEKELDTRSKHRQRKKWPRSELWPSDIFRGLSEQKLVLDIGTNSSEELSTSRCFSTEKKICSLYTTRPIHDVNSETRCGTKMRSTNQLRYNTIPSSTNRDEYLLGSKYLNKCSRWGSKYVLRPKKLKKWLTSFGKQLESVHEVNKCTSTKKMWLTSFGGNSFIWLKSTSYRADSYIGCIQGSGPDVPF